MSTRDEKSETENSDLANDGKELTFVELIGRVPKRWRIHRGRLFQRISKAATEVVRRLMKARGPRGRTVSEETHTFFSLGLSSLEAFLERPVLENMKRKIEIEREVKALRASTTTHASTQEDAVGEARQRKVAYDVFLELLAAGKIHPIRDGDSVTLLVQNLSEADMEAFAKVRGYTSEKLDSSDKV